MSRRSLFAFLFIVFLISCGVRKIAEKPDEPVCMPTPTTNRATMLNSMNFN